MSFHALLSQKWLAGRILRKNSLPAKDSKERPVKIVDSTWSLGRPDEGKIVYMNNHIPGAVHFDIDDCADKNSNLPRMLPHPEDFEYYVGKCCGISNDHHVIIYDRGLNSNIPLMSSFRVWWMFRVFGHNRVSILDGGYRAWERAGNPISDKVPDFDHHNFKAKFQPGLLTSLDDVLRGVNTGSGQIVDSRGEGSFNTGHILNSASIPFPELFEANSGNMKSTKELKLLFNTRDLDINKTITASCGSGVTACGLAFAVHLMGKEASVYDGSWSEFAAQSSDKIGRLTTKD